MKKLDQLVLKSAIGPFLVTLFIGNLVFLMQFIYRKLDEIVGKGLGIDVLAEFVMYASFTLVPYSLPLAVLIASIMTMGNLGERYELVAMKSSGVSLLRILRPLIIAAFVMSGVAFFFSNTVMPFSLLKLSALRWDIKNKKPTMLIEEGIFFNDLENMTMKVDRKGKDGTLYDLVIYDHRKAGEATVIKADSAKIINSDSTSYMVLDLMDGKIHTEKEFKNEYIRYAFKRQNFPIDMSSFQMSNTDESLFKGNPKIKNIARINHSLDSLNLKKGDRIQKLREKLPFHFKALDYSKSLPDSLITENITLKDKVKKDSLRIYQDAINRVKFQKQEIAAKQTSLKNINKLINDHKIAWYQKFALAFSCVILFFIGAPLGALVRKGGFGMPIVISIFFYLLYYIINITGTRLAENGQVSPLIGIWLSTIVLLPLAILLTRMAVLDMKMNPFASIQGLINSLVKSFRNK